MPQQKEARLREYAQKLSDRIDALKASATIPSEKAILNVADALPVMVWMASPSGENTYSNAQYVEFFGAGHGYNWVEILHPEDRRGVLDAWAASVASGETYHRTARFRDKTGCYHPVVTRAHAVRGEDGQIRYWAGTSCLILDMCPAVLLQVVA
jgi:PAS domain-containing protein